MSKFNTKNEIKDDDLPLIVALLQERKKAIQAFNDAKKAKREAREQLDNLTYVKIGEKFGYSRNSIQKLVYGENHVAAMDRLFPNVELR